MVEICGGMWHIVAKWEMLIKFRYKPEIKVAHSAGVQMVG
jgi:hypothetical protein